MSMTDHFRLFAEYNRLMNSRIYDAACALPVTDLRADRGAFFKSVLGTLNHILVGDIIWLKRFSNHPSSKNVLSQLAKMDPPNALNEILFNDLSVLRDERLALDDVIVQWTGSLSDEDLQGFVVYESMDGRGFQKPFSSLISHLFLHQVHHRGQITTLLSQSGVDFGDTDLVELIREGRP